MPSVRDRIAQFAPNSVVLTIAASIARTGTHQSCSPFIEDEATAAASRKANDAPEENDFNMVAKEYTRAPIVSVPRITRQREDVKTLKSMCLDRKHTRRLTCTAMFRVTTLALEKVTAVQQATAAARHAPCHACRTTICTSLADGVFA